MALQLVITNAGRAAVIDQAKGGFRAVRIAAVGVSPTAVTAAPVATALADEVKRITTIAGEATATDVTHLTVTDESSDSYTVRSFALYLADGTLFALYGQPDAIVQKSAQALLLLAIDVALSTIPAAQLTFGNANFTNPAATTERAGVVELATAAEAAALADATRALTPKTITAIFTAANILSRLLAVDGAGSGLDADLLDGRHASAFLIRGEGTRPLDYDYGYGTMTIRADTGGWALGYAFQTSDGSPLGGFGVLGGGNSLPTYYYVGRTYDAANNLRVYPSRVSYGDNVLWHAGNDGAGSGLDADLLDGRHAADFALLSGASFSGTLTVGTSTSGHVALAPAGGTANTGYVEFSRATGVREGFIGFAPTAGQIQLTSENGAGFNVTGGPLTHGGALVWDAGNDGAGSGLDADLLDGREAAEFALLSGARFTGLVRVQSQEAIRLTGKDGFIAFYSADEQSRRGYLQFYGTSGALVNDGGGALHLQTGGTNVLTAGPGGVAITGGLSRGGNVVWDAGNDGSGSGLDADLLDGWERDAVRDWNNILNRPATFPAAAHTHGAADLATAFTGTLSDNGYTVLPNGLLLQWVTGAQQAAGTETTQTVTFPIAFNACFQVIAATQVANADSESHAVYQLVSFTAESATVMRQLVNTAGADRQPSWPRLFAIGR